MNSVRYVRESNDTRGIEENLKIFVEGFGNIKMASNFNLSQPLYYIKDHFPEQYFPDTILPNITEEIACDQLRFVFDTDLPIDVKSFRTGDTNNSVPYFLFIVASCAGVVLPRGSY